MGGVRAGGRFSALSLPVDAFASVEFRTFAGRTPLLSVGAGGLLVTLTLPCRLGPADVEFTRRLAEQTAAYAAEVERRYRVVRPGPTSGKGAAA